MHTYVYIHMHVHTHIQIKIKNAFESRDLVTNFSASQHCLRQTRLTKAGQCQYKVTKNAGLIL